MKPRNSTEVHSIIGFVCICLAFATTGSSQNQLNDQLRPNDQKIKPLLEQITPTLPKPPPLSGALVFEVEPGFTRIFNGKDLSGWDGNSKLWSVKDGAIVGQTTAENPIKVNTFLIWTNSTTADFELRCSFRITSQNDKGFANSGIQYRSKVLDTTNWVVGGYQADMEAGPTYTGILYDERGVAGGREEEVRA